MKQKLLTLALLLCACLQTWADDWTDDNGVTWSYTLNNSEATINGASKTSGDLVIPSTVNGYTVTDIGSNAFKDCSGLTSVTIPSSVTTIGSYAFRGCSGLKKVIVPDLAAWCGISFSNYSSNPLYYAHRLYSDEYTKITSLVIPEGVTRIGDYAFYYCTGLTSVTIPEGMESIGDKAFYYCTGLTSVTIPSCVTSIGPETFSGCTGLTSVTINSDSILSKTFTSSSNLGTIFGSQVNEYIIGEGVESIGDYAFSGCTGLASVTIPLSVTSMGNATFDGCTGLTSVTINSNEILSKDYTYFKSKFGVQVKEYIIGEGVTRIGAYAFSGCTGLTSVNIPSSVTSIGSHTFDGCSSLTKVIVPDIAAWCNLYFWEPSDNPLYWAKHLYNDDNTEIKDLVIPSSVTNIRSNAFSGCAGVTSVTIPSSVTSIRDAAFSGCSGLTSVTINSKAIMSKSYSSFSNLGTFFGNQVQNYIIGEGVTSIGDYAFVSCSGLTSVTIPSSVTSIGDYVFSGCTGLTSVTVPSSVTSIGRGAFYNCTGLTSVTINSNAIVSKYYSLDSSEIYLKDIFGTQVRNYIIGEGVTSIGNAAFYGCSRLTSVTIPSSVTSIGGAAFYGCTGLTSVTIPEGVTEIGCSLYTEYYAFYGCSRLTSVTINSNAIVSKNYTSEPYLKDFFGNQVKNYIIGEGVTSIGEKAFYGLTDLTSVTIGESVTSIGEKAFYGCTHLWSVTINSDAIMSNSRVNHLGSIFGSQVIECIIGEGVTSIGSAFVESSLKSVTIPSSVTSIGYHAFYGCSGMTSVYCYAPTPPSVSFEAFYHCTQATLYVPYGSKSAYQNADSWKEFYHIIEMDYPSGIEDIDVDTDFDNDFDNDIEVYDLNGLRQPTMHRGVNIIRMNDGTTKKVLVK